ncbi:hypothetical protein AYI70_g9599 [Smittium culicis]|uniref:Uncharacterized protein n=1 Tax=Smittium culicis TaxID=133412 RepID=A0A1R1XAG9_9FUNG|nr:hypothetical protein AYI70_g9599 [Smittium culicis]
MQALFTINDVSIIIKLHALSLQNFPLPEYLGLHVPVISANKEIARDHAMARYGERRERILPKRIANRSWPALQIIRYFLVRRKLALFDHSTSIEYPILKIGHRPSSLWINHFLSVLS